MTEGNDDDSWLVHVRAQVMTRDDNSGGWVPLGSGGLSNVSVCKRPLIATDHEEHKKHEYYIYGKRISDQSVILSCIIKKDFEYNKVMPTFHHWKTGDKKFGLTFQTAADARAFDKGVCMAVEDLRDGLREISGYHYDYDVDVADDDVFITVHLPVERDGSRSSSGSVTTCSSSRHTPTTTPLPTPDIPPPIHHHHVYHYYPSHSQPPVSCQPVTNTSPCSTISSTGIISNTGAFNQSFMHPHTNHHHFHKMNIMPRPVPAPPIDRPPPLVDSLDKTSELTVDPNKIEVLADNYSYVQFASDKHLAMRNEYSYPIVENLKNDRRDSIASLKKAQQMELVQTQSQMPPMLPCKRPRKTDRKSRKMAKPLCRHCHDIFKEETNTRGSCEYAPDYVRTAIDKITCISCARCMLYHCMSDAEGDFPHHPCDCGDFSMMGRGPQIDSSGCGKRWLGLTLLSLLVPCLCCYLPLRACHKCAVTCGICGGRHEAS